MRKNKLPIRIFATFVMVLLFLTASFQMVIRLSEREMEAYVEKETQQRSEYVNVMANVNFQAHNWVACSFLSGMLDYRTYLDSTTGQLEYRAVLRDDHRDFLPLEEIFNRLESFCCYNYDIYSAALVFEPGVLPRFPKGVAACVSSVDSLRIDLLANDRTLLTEGFYPLVKEKRGIVGKDGIARETGLTVYTLGVPIFSESGRVIGELWMDTEPNIYSKMLIDYRSADNLATCYVDENQRVLASSDSTVNGQALSCFGSRVFGEVPLQDWCQQVDSCMARHENSHFEMEMGGQRFLTYVLPIAGTSQSMIMVKSVEDLNHWISRIMWGEYVMMLVGLFLVSLCLLSLASLFKQKHDEQGRMKNELGMAAVIQQGILPPPLEPSAVRRPFDIYGFQRSATSVGGDLYDYVQKGDVLHFCIGDVSGKGMPAALVMSELCSLYRYVVSECSDPCDIVTRINKAVMERSDDSMFCTFFVGVLHLSSGRLEFCNAGHNPPLLISKEGTNFLRVKANMPIYAFENYVYKSESLQLAPGDRLILYTDGVTEAKKGDDTLYGDETFRQTVEGVRDADFETLVQGVMCSVHTFVGSAVQYDDITMLGVEYRGGGGVSLHYDGVKGRVMEVVESALEACGSQDDTRLRLALEEPIQNVADYAYGEADGPLDVTVNVGTNDVTFVLTDSGEPFNPLEAATPDFSVPIMARNIGGLGIYFTRQIMKETSYRYENNNNILTLKYKK